MNVPSATAPEPDLELPGGAPANRKLAWWLVLVLTVAGINYALNYAAPSTASDKASVLYTYTNAVGGTIVYALLLALLLAIVGTQRELLALRPPRSWLKAAGLALLVLVVIAVANSLLDPFLHAGREQGVVPKQWLPKHAGAYVANWVVVAAVAPFVEELTYRGAGFSLLGTRLGAWPAILAIGVLFALAHGLLQALPELAILGAALAWLRWKTASVFPGMIVHSLFNSFALASVFFK